MPLHYAIAQILGGRDSQEDVCAVRAAAGTLYLNGEDVRHGTADGEMLAVCCDGMGGHQAGEVAAQIAAKAFVNTAREKLDTGAPVAPSLLAACAESNRAIAKESARNPAFSVGDTSIRPS